MTDAQRKLETFIKIRADLSGAESVFWWTGNIYSYIPGERSQRLFSFEGFNVARIIRAEGGYQMLTREAAFYKDPTTGEILEHWHNPLNECKVEVVHVWNDPVNQQFMAQSERGPFSVPSEDLGNGATCYYFDALLAYPSPLPRAEYPLNSQNDLYQGAELFQFFVQNEDFDEDSSDVPCAISWTRLGPWLPWMEMADAPGNVLYQCRGAKLKGGYEGLSEQIRSYVETHHPEYQHPPETFTKPNETSWTYFKKGKFRGPSEGSSE